MTLHDAIRPMRVVVVDDDEDGRDDMMDELLSGELEAILLDRVYGNRIDKMVYDILAEQPHLVVCDHKLQPQGMATFYGSDVVRELLGKNVPAMLVTVFQSTNRLELRKTRDKLPVVLSRRDFRVEDVPDYIEVCRRELHHQPVEERRPHRVLIRVEAVEPGRIDAVIPSWSPDQAISIPIELVDLSIRGQLQPDVRLLGFVNIGAVSEDDLFFVGLDEIVPVPENLP